MARKTYIFVDTNILVRFLSQGMPGCEDEQFHALKALLEQSKVTLLVPEIITIEVETFARMFSKDINN